MELPRGYYNISLRDHFDILFKTSTATKNLTALQNKLQFNLSYSINCSRFVFRYSIDVLVVDIRRNSRDICTLWTDSSLTITNSYIAYTSGGIYLFENYNSYPYLFNSARHIHFSFILYSFSMY